MPDTELISSLEAQILDLHETAANELHTLKEAACHTAVTCANLGEHLDEWQRQTRTPPAAMWERLRALHPSLREDVLRFAKRAALARKRGQLESPDQLMFLLANDQATTTAEPPMRHYVNEVMLCRSSCVKVASFFTDWTTRQPVERWDDSTKRAVKASLQPMVDLYDKLTNSHS